MAAEGKDDAAAALRTAYRDGVAAAVAATDDRARAAAVGALHALLQRVLLPAAGTPVAVAEVVLLVCAEPEDHSKGLEPAVTALVGTTCSSSTARPAAANGIDEDDARELLVLLSAVPPRCLFALCSAVLAGPAGDAPSLLWGPLQVMMAEAGNGAGLLAPGHNITRKERAEALTLWFSKATRAALALALPEVDLAASILCRWMDECDTQAAAASTGNAAAHLPNALQARLLRAGVAFAASVDAHAVELVLNMLQGRPLGYRATLDGWAAAITTLGMQSKLKRRKTVAMPASVQDVAPSLLSDLICFVTSGAGDVTNGLSGPAARVIAQLLAEDITECKVQPAAKACGHGVRTLCAALLQGSASAHERLCAAVIAPLCKSAPSAVSQVLDNLLGASDRQGLGSALAVAAAGLGAGGKAATLVLERLHVDTLDNALAHVDEGLRVAALKLCCQIAAVVPRRKASRSTLNADSVLPVLQRRLRYCAYGIGAHGGSRQRHDDFINAVGLLLRQFHRTLMEGTNESCREDLKPTVLEWATTVAKWCGWLRTWLFACLCPGAPFPRVSLTLAILHEHASLFWTAKQQLQPARLDTECQKTRLLDLVCGQRSPETTRWELDALCQLLESTYPRIRELAYEVLLQLDVPASVSHSPGVAERGYQLMSSLRLRQFDAGALLMRLLYRRKDSPWWAAEFHQCTHRDPSVIDPTAALAMYAAWAFSGEHTEATHGSVRCLRYVLSDFSFDAYTSDADEWSTPVGRLLETMCESILDKLKVSIDQVKVECESKGADHDNSALLTGPTDLSNDRQMATVVLDVVELCRLIGTLSERLGFAHSERSREGLKLSHHFASSCLQELLYAALILPHMGAISGVADSLESVLAKLLRADGCIPIIVKWREVLLENLSGPRILRRSTGMTTAVMAMLRPLASQVGPRKLQSDDLQVGKTIRDLLKLATAACNRTAESSQVAALDALTMCFRHRGIMVAAQTEATAIGNDLLPQALQIAITIQSSEHWAAQNSAAQLFDAVAQRLAGDGGLQVGNTEGSRAVTLASCLAAHPSLESVILELIDSTQAARAHFYILLFLGLFKPSELVRHQAEHVAQAHRLLTFIGTCNAAPCARLREASATALAALVPIESLPKAVEVRVRVLTAQQPPRSTNSAHGLWLQVLLLVRSTRLYADAKAHAVHATLLPLLQDARVNSLMDPQSLNVALEIVHEFESRLRFEPSSGDCVDVVVSDLVANGTTTCKSCAEIGLRRLSKRLGVAATRLQIRRSVSLAPTGEVYCPRNLQGQVSNLLSHHLLEVRLAAARQIKWIVKHRFTYTLEFARDTHLVRGSSHVGWLSMQIVRRIVAEVAAPVLKQLLRLLQELVRINEPIGLAGVLSLAAQETSTPAVSLAQLTNRLWAWASQHEQSCTTTRALALQVLGCGRGQARLSSVYDSVLLQTIDCVEWIRQLQDASDSAQQLYLRGHAADALFISGALDTDMGNQESQIRAWLLAVTLLQDDDSDVRECARQGLAEALMTANYYQPGNGPWMSASALIVMEASWSYMTSMFGTEQLYVEALVALVAGSRSDLGPQSPGLGQHHDDGSLWDSNDEEGDNIFVDMVMQGQLASLQLHRCPHQADGGVGEVTHLDAGMPVLFLLSDEAQQSVLRG